MTGNHEGRTAPLEFTRRDWKPQFAAVALPSVIYAGMTIFLLANVALDPGEGWWLRLQQIATVLGRGVIDQLGWVLSILIAIQLGCLIAVLGGQIHARNRRDEADLRVALGLFSVLPVVGLSPALTVASIAAVRVGELRGALFVIVPVIALATALSVFIGTFDVADEITKREFVEAEEERAQRHIAALEDLPPAPFWRTGLLCSALVVLSVAAVSVILGLFTGASTPPGWVLWSSLVLNVVSVSATWLALGGISATLKPALTATGLVTAVLLVVSLLAMQTIVVTTLFALRWQLGVGGLIGALLLAAEATRVHLEAREVRAGRKSDGFWRRGGALARVGTSIARKAAGKELDSARARLEELEPKISLRVAEEPRTEGRRRREDGVLGGG